MFCRRSGFVRPRGLTQKCVGRPLRTAWKATLRSPSTRLMKGCEIFHHSDEKEVGEMRPLTSATGIETSPAFTQKRFGHNSVSMIKNRRPGFNAFKTRPNGPRDQVNWKNRRLPTASLPKAARAQPAVRLRSWLKTTRRLMDGKRFLQTARTSGTRPLRSPPTENTV